MKSVAAFLGILVISSFWISFVSVAQAPQGIPQLTQISPREFVDLASIDYIRYSVLVDYSGVCDPDYVQTTGGWLLVNGGTSALTSEAEDAFRKLQKQPPAATIADCVPKVKGQTQVVERRK